MESSKDICIAYSDDFLKHKCPQSHPEQPERIALSHHLFGSGGEFSYLAKVVSAPISKEKLAWVHGSAQVEQLWNVQGKQGWLDADTFYVPDSIHTARLAAATCVEMSTLIWKGKYRRGFALVRPPGHHATSKKAMGFCLFNHIALAVQAVRAENPQARLAIVDFDLHHGNGTQDIFNHTDQVLFVSSHRYPFYPGTGSFSEVGEGKGRGTSVNLPLDKDYDESLVVPLYERVVLSVLESYQPDMIFVSAGFDGHCQDPMQGLRLTEESYRQLARLLCAAAEKLCQGKILFCLEGGYNPEAVKQSVQSVLHEMVHFPRMPTDLNIFQDNWNQPLLDELSTYFKAYFSEGVR